MPKTKNPQITRRPVTAAALTTTLMAGLLLAGCSDSNDDDGDNNNGNDNNETPGLTAGVNGSWRTNCNQQPEGNGFLINELIIDNGTFVRTLNTFLDGSCEFQDQSQTSSGTFLETGSTEVEGRGTATNVDFTSTELGLALFQDADIASANEADLCGAEWSAGVVNDISNCSDVNNSTVPNTAFTLFLLENDELFLAEVVTTVEERPTTLDELPHLRVE